MTFASKTIKVDFDKADESKRKKMRLNSGRRILVHAVNDEELLEIKEADGKLLLEVRLTRKGPVLSFKGAKLSLSAMKEIVLDAEKVSIHSTDETRISSQGFLKINTKKNMDFKSREDIRLKSKTIHLN